MQYLCFFTEIDQRRFSVTTDAKIFLILILILVVVRR